MTQGRAIGIFDSGVGGLAVAAAIRRMLPQEPIVYFADTANFPYGPRSADDVLGLSRAATRALLTQGAKMVVVACNTASSAALTTLRSDFPGVPFVGMVPAIKPAAQASRSHKVGVLATRGTLQAQVLDDLVVQFADGVEVERIAAPELAELVEFGDPGNAEGEALVSHFVEPLLAHDVDVIVLGCTHFAFLRPQVQRMAGEDVVVLDTAEPVARQVKRVLEERGLANADGEGSFRCLTSGDPAALAETLERLRKAAPDLLPAIDSVDGAPATAVAEPR